MIFFDSFERYVLFVDQKDLDSVSSGDFMLHLLEFRGHIGCSHEKEDGGLVYTGLYEELEEEHKLIT